MSDRMKKCLALTLAQVLVFTHAYAAGAQPLRAPVLRQVALAHVRAQVGDQQRLGEQEFVAARDKMVADLDRAIERLAASTLSDEALRGRAVTRIRATMRKSEEMLARYVRTQMDAAAVQQALDQAMGDARYGRCLARHKDPRDALAACLALDVRTAAAQAEKTIGAKTKADVLSDLQNSRARLTALAYDGADYDEYFELSWYVWHSDDALIWALSPAFFVLDVLLSPVVFCYKMAHWLFID